MTKSSLIATCVWCGVKFQPRCNHGINKARKTCSKECQDKQMIAQREANRISHATKRKIAKDAIAAAKAAELAEKKKIEKTGVINVYKLVNKKARAFARCP